MNQPEIRVRFAPSPTGALHIGGVRTALYNYLFAKKHNGKFLLRIEDTDQNRYVDFAENYIKESLEWLGIVPDESPWAGGLCSPYRQSERKEIYQEYAHKMVAEGKAYYAFDTAEELEAMRKRLETEGVSNPQYNALSREQMKNSLTLPKEEVEARLKAGEPYTIRIKVPRKEEIRLNDLVRGWVVVHSSQIDDKVLLKSDGMPTYHLANVVDDYLMGITHVIRGEEWLPSAPLHVLLYRFLGWEAKMPQFAHLPLLLKPDGNGKLSKRDGDMHGFPVFPLAWTNPETQETVRGFREEGYLPEALINFLAFLGWNPGTEQEIFSLDELVQAFSIEKISKAGAKFDIKKAQWFNQYYIKQKDNAFWVNYLLQNCPYPLEKIQAEAIVALLKDRITFPKDFWEQAPYLFQTPENYDEQTLASKWTNEVSLVLKQWKTLIPTIDNKDWNAENIKHTLQQITENQGIKLGKVMQPIRIALTGVAQGADLMLIAQIIGKDETLKRIEKILAKMLQKEKI
ncbi:MAG: glutamate--tRNA ligase [Microscillaceae bacterium]|nr:glutamate--tRNA ligase [Microscillaceae bacterium]MDW8460959.1 glutamate--tRNA ligase [Cytophagales bacterium]